MISQIKSTYSLNSSDEAILIGLQPYLPGIWDKSEVSTIKAEIHKQLLAIQQNNCCYCGLKVNEGGRAELDHIAKKGGPKRPAYTEFVFTPKNLAITCQYCNSSSKKGQEDVLSFVDSANYENCQFKIVHPYFHDPEKHYTWSKGKYKILISGISNEAKYSIELFELDSEAHTLARAKQKMFEKKLENYNWRQSIKERVLKIMTFR